MKRIGRFWFRILSFFTFSPFRIILFVSILLFSTNVFAETVTNKIEALPSFGGGTYTGYTPATVVVPAYYNVNTRYNGKLSIVEFYINTVSGWTSWNYNKTYTITLNMATEDWRNNFMGPQVYSAQSNGTKTGSNLYVSNSFKFISYKSIKFNFKLGSTLGPYLYFRLYSGNTTNTGITGVSNWNLSSVTITSVSSATPTPAPVTPTPRPATPTPQPNNQDIINNANQNTQDIINNQTQNSQDIINNQNQNTNDIMDNQTSNTSDIIDNNNANTQDIIENNNANTTCPSGPLVLSWDEWSNPKHFYLNGVGEEIFTNNYGISPYLSIKPNTQYTINTSGGSMPTQAFYCLYTNKDSVSACYNYDSSGTTTFTTTQYQKYLRLSLLKVRTVEVKGPVCNNWDKEGLNAVNDTIKDDNIDDNTGFFSGFEDNDHGLSSIITIPLSTIQQLTNSSCVALSVPIPFTNSNISLPCMTQVYETYIPNVYNIWKVVSFGIISYLICLDIFHIVKGFKDPNEDKVEVLDL